MEQGTHLVYGYVIFDQCNVYKIEHLQTKSMFALHYIPYNNNTRYKVRRIKFSQKKAIRD